MPESSHVIRAAAAQTATDPRLRALLEFAIHRDDRVRELEARVEALERALSEKHALAASSVEVASAAVALARRMRSEQEPARPTVHVRDAFRVRSIAQEWRGLVRTQEHGEDGPEGMAAIEQVFRLLEKLRALDAAAGVLTEEQRSILAPYFIRPALAPAEQRRRIALLIATLDRVPDSMPEDL